MSEPSSPCIWRINFSPRTPPTTDPKLPFSASSPQQRHGHDAGLANSRNAWTYRMDVCLHLAHHHTLEEIMNGYVLCGIFTVMVCRAVAKSAAWRGFKLNMRNLMKWTGILALGLTILGGLIAFASAIGPAWFLIWLGFLIWWTGRCFLPCSCCCRK